MHSLEQQKLIERNNINFAGKGTQNLVMLHGFATDQSMWKYILPYFEERFNIIMFDHVGSGESDLQSYNYEKYSSVQGYADDLLEICQAFNLQNVTVLAHSISSMISLLAYKKSPGLFSSIIMLSPSPCYTNVEDYKGGFSKNDIADVLNVIETNFAGWSNQMSPAIIGDLSRTDLSEELKATFLKNNLDIVKHFARVVFSIDYREELPSIFVPVLILLCEEDIMVPTSVGKYMAEQLPHNEFVQLNSLGHCPHLTAPEKTADEALNFLQSIA